LLIASRRLDDVGQELARKIRLDVQDASGLVAFAIGSRQGDRHAQAGLEILHRLESLDEAAARQVLACPAQPFDEDQRAGITQHVAQFGAPLPRRIGEARSWPV
jgi:hypothetical protein